VGDKLRRLGGEFAELAQVGLTAVLSATFNAPLFGLVAPMTRDAGAAERDPEGAAVIELPKTKKLVVYLLSIAGALGTMVALRAMFGAGGGLPHFEGMDLGRVEVALLVPLALAGGAVGWLYHAFDRGAQGVSAKLGERPVVKGALAGLVLAACGIALPFTMFAGEHQATELGEVWTGVAGLTLVATALVKVFVTPLCVRFGWRGGHFFPVIFAGIALGFGMAQLTGVDAIFAVCTCTAGLVGAVMRKPLLTVLLLFLCFPVKAAPILLAAAAIGSAFPLPKGWGAAH